jgi:hypothetical protein
MASARHRAQIDRMSRLRRPFLYSRYIFVTVKLLPWRDKLNPVKRGLVKRPEEWKRSSFPEFAGVDAEQ